MISEINPNLVREFRGKVHENNDFIRCYFVEFKQNSNKEGKDIWSKICSCMDWLTVAADAIEKPKRHKNANYTSLEFTHFITTIDMIVEAINHLWLAIGEATKTKQPYIKDRSIFQKKEFDKELTDEAYFKEIRAWFGIHAVNGNATELEGFKQPVRFFSSWSTNSRWDEEGTFYIQLYSNNPTAEKKYGGRKEIKVDDLLKFVTLRYNTLTQLMSEIDALYSRIKKELKERPVHLDESKPELTQLRQLIEQAKERKLTSEFYEYDILTYESFLECDLVEFRSIDRELVSNYLMDLKPIIPIYKNIIQNVDDSEYDIFQKLHMCSQIYAENSYDFAKVLEYADGHGSYTSGIISLELLIEKGVLPAYSTNLSGVCLSLLIHALDYKFNKTHPRKLKKRECVQIIDDLSDPLISIIVKDDKVKIEELFKEDIRKFNKENK